MERKPVGRKALIVSIPAAVVVLLVTLSFLPITPKSDPGANSGKNDMIEDVAIVSSRPINDDGRSIAEQLSSQGITVIEVYQAFVLVSLGPGQHESLVQQGYDVQTLQNRTIIGRGDYRFDTRSGEPSIPPELRVNLTQRPNYDKFILQFVGPIKQEWKDKVASYGVVLFDYLPSYGFMVQMNSSLEPGLEQLYFVQWVGLYQPAYKISGSLLDSTDRWIDVTIVMFPTSSSQDVQNVTDLISDAGGQVNDVWKEDAQVMAAWVPPAALLPLVQDGEVSWIEENSPAHTMQS